MQVYQSERDGTIMRLSLLQRKDRNWRPQVPDVLGPGSGLKQNWPRGEPNAPWPVHHTSWLLLPQLLPEIADGACGLAEPDPGDDAEFGIIAHVELATERPRHRTRAALDTSEQHRITV